MKRAVINPPQLVEPRGFNHGFLVEGGRLLFLAGQDASDANGSIVAPGDLIGQFEQLLKNLEAVVEEAGGSMQDIVKLNVFVADGDDYRANLKPLGAIFRDYFDGHYPAMALFEVAGFFREDNLVEMEGFAVLSDE